MGSPLGTTLANFFLGCLEEIIFENNCYVVPKLYLRYIDDTYALFNNKKDCFEFLDILNSQHNYTKFKIEQSTKANNLIFFLDVQVKLLNDDYETNVWRKSTNTVYCLILMLSDQKYGNLDCICVFYIELNVFVQNMNCILKKCKSYG